MTDEPFTLPEGSALVTETEIGIASMDEVVRLLEQALAMERIDDLDRTTILLMITGIKGIPGVLRQAIDLLNKVAEAHDEDTRIHVGQPMIPMSMITVGLLTMEDEDDDV